MRFHFDKKSPIAILSCSISMDAAKSAPTTVTFLFLTFHDMCTHWSTIYVQLTKEIKREKIGFPG